MVFRVYCGRLANSQRFFLLFYKIDQLHDDWSNVVCLASFMLEGFVILWKFQ